MKANRDLNSTDKLIGVEIFDALKSPKSLERGFIAIAEPTLAQRCGVSLSSVERAVRNQVAAGHLMKVRGYGAGNANCYSLPRRRRTAPERVTDEGEATVKITPQERRPISTVAPPGPAPSPAPAPRPEPVLSPAEIEARRQATEEAKERTNLCAFLGKVAGHAPALAASSDKIGRMTLPQVRALARTIADLARSGAPLTPEAIRDCMECAALI